MTIRSQPLETKRCWGVSSRNDSRATTNISRPNPSSTTAKRCAITISYSVRSRVSTALSRIYPRLRLQSGDLGASRRALHRCRRDGRPLVARTRRSYARTDRRSDQGNRAQTRGAGYCKEQSAERDQASVSLHARGVALKPTRSHPAAIVQYLPDDAGAVGVARTDTATATKCSGGGALAPTSAT